jgi:hypothetical protein
LAPAGLQLERPRKKPRSLDTRTMLIVETCWRTSLWPIPFPLRIGWTRRSSRCLASLSRALAINASAYLSFGLGVPFYATGAPVQRIAERARQLSTRYTCLADTASPPAHIANTIERAVICNSHDMAVPPWPVAELISPRRKFRPFRSLRPTDFKNLLRAGE